jgi:hypothetical protein
MVVVLMVVVMVISTTAMERRRRRVRPLSGLDRRNAKLAMRTRVSLTNHLLFVLLSTYTSQEHWRVGKHCHCRQFVGGPGHFAAALSVPTIRIDSNDTLSLGRGRRFGLCQSPHGQYRVAHSAQ